MFKSVFSPIKLNQLEIRNRLVVPPCSHQLQERARRGYRPSHRISRGTRQGRLWVDSLGGHGGSPVGDRLPQRHRAVERRADGRIIKAGRGSTRQRRQAGCAFYHAGQQTYSAVLGGQSVSASPVPCPVCSRSPGNSLADIAELVKAFARAAEG